MKKYYVFILLLLTVFLFGQEKEILDGNTISYTYKNNNLKIEVSGTSIIKSFDQNGYHYIETHINPSLGELIQINKEHMTFIKYNITIYTINKSDDILIVLDPPHFSKEIYSQEIRINNLILNNTINKQIKTISNYGYEFKLITIENKDYIIKKIGNEWNIISGKID